MLTTVDRARTLLQADPEDDPLLALLIPAASAAIETYCNRTFGYGKYTERAGGEGRHFISLRNYPIVTVESIDGKTDLSDYTIEADRGMIWSQHGNLKNPVAVTYKAGYVLPGQDPIDGVLSLPADIEYACILMIDQIQRVPGVTSERVGDLSVNYGQDDGKMPAAVRALVGPYRNVNI